MLINTDGLVKSKELSTAQRSRRDKASYNEHPVYNWLIVTEQFCLPEIVWISIPHGCCNSVVVSRYMHDYAFCMGLSGGNIWAGDALCLEFKLLQPSAMTLDHNEIRINTPGA
jgi:hypothetical protein